MKYTAEQVLELLANDEELFPSGKSLDEIANLHCVLADMVEEGKIEMVLVDGRPAFKAPISVPILIGDLTFTPEMLN